MWNQITVPFARLLGSKLYPTLFENSDYREFLRLCGVVPPYPIDISALSGSQRMKMEQNAHLRANLLSLDLNSLGALRQAGAEAVEINGPKPIYRLCNSLVSGSELRFFWFEEDLLWRSLHEGGATKKLRLEWLRAHLAVSYNWSLCDQVARMRLKKNDAILGVRAEGLPMRGVQIGKTDTSVRLPADYHSNFKKYSATLPGGESQLFLYLLPKDSIEMYW